MLLKKVKKKEEEENITLILEFNNFSYSKNKTN